MGTFIQSLIRWSFNSFILYEFFFSSKKETDFNDFFLLVFRFERILFDFGLSFWWMSRVLKPSSADDKSFFLSESKLDNDTS